MYNNLTVNTSEAKYNISRIIERCTYLVL